MLNCFAQSSAGIHGQLLINLSFSLIGFDWFMLPDKSEAPTTHSCVRFADNRLHSLIPNSAACSYVYIVFPQMTTADTGSCVVPYFVLG